MTEETLRERYRDSFEMYRSHQFFVRMAKGQVTPTQWGILLAQDARYLSAFGQRLRELADAVDNEAVKETLNRHHRDAASMSEVATGIVVTSLGLPEITHEELRGPTAAYIDHQYRSLRAGVREGMMSILPCYLFYPYFVVQVRRAAGRSEPLEKILAFVSTEQEAHRWAGEILKVWNVLGLADAEGDESPTHSRCRRITKPRCLVWCLAFRDHPPVETHRRAQSPDSSTSYPGQAREFQLSGLGIFQLPGNLKRSIAIHLETVGSFLEGLCPWLVTS